MTTKVIQFRPGTPERIRVSFDARDRDGYVRVRPDRFATPPRIDEDVFAYDVTEETEALARVHHINEQTGFVYLAVNWETLNDLDSASHLGASAGAHVVARISAIADGVRKISGTIGSSNAVKYPVDQGCV